MTNKEYQEMVEKKFKKKLREVMHDLCVKRSVVAYEGAEILGVPKKTFEAWRTRYRFGPLQLQADYAEKQSKEQIEAYSEELKDVDILRSFQLQDETSLAGFQEVLLRYLELYKAKRITVDSGSTEEMLLMMRIRIFEEILQLLDSYLQGEHHDKFMRAANFLLMKMNRSN
ncbi:hypothetical protein CIG75_00615 [Tumebacillus algifaecis]|uniref:Uncharacterized protein n=1 Tax=Tumebacillus algifaecis TaxID=1214604 RepID=A0A223CWM9_9BACL|nr:hypothetical protein [Tumebacillus algifaecis]ASS73625.1 hypothetical protein CIG75_00615 [Tumebacillus algifaecis]